MESTRRHKEQRWYARRNGTVRGPFTGSYVQRYILLGRIQPDDELSHDRLRWQTVNHFPELFPEELSGLSSGGDYRELVMARLKVDERATERRQARAESGPPEGQERRRLAERRRIDSNALFFRFHLMNRNMRSGPGGPGQPQHLRVLLLAILLATLLAAHFSSIFR